MTQAATTPILPSVLLLDPRPVDAPAEAIVYLPEIHSRGGSYFPELHTGDTSKATIVADIASAQHDDVRRVVAFDLIAGTSWDASKEIAQAVLDAILTDYARVPAWCIDFLEEHLGVHTVRAAERAS